MVVFLYIQCEIVANCSQDSPFPPCELSTSDKIFDCLTNSPRHYHREQCGEHTC